MTDMPPVSQGGMYPPYYPVEGLETMYPEVYYKCYPVIRSMCERYDVPSNPSMHPAPTRLAVTQMADQIYNYVVINLGVRDDCHCTDGAYTAEQFGPGPATGPGTGRGLLRTLITILLIRELLFRRRRYA